MRARNAVAVLAAGSAAALLVRRRLRGTEREHVDVYFDDGSMISFPGSSDEARRVLPLARELLAATG